MKKVVYVSLYKGKKGDGILKKILSQAIGFSKNGYKCELVYIEENEIKHSVYVNGKLKNTKILSSQNDINIALKFAASIPEVNFYYIRMTNPQLRILNFIIRLKKQGNKIGYEIPTYPFFYEQFQVSSNKIKGLSKVILYAIYLPIVFLFIDKIFVVKAKQKKKLRHGMISIYNGISDDSVTFSRKKIEYDKLNKINFIGVGTIYNYHGYDRLIKAIAEYYKEKHDKEIFFHIVGSGKEIKNLKKLSKDLEIEDKIIFHGVVCGSELDDIYKISQIGVGTLSLDKRNADIDTAIKNIEYFSKRLYVISSGMIFDLSNDLYSIIDYTKDVDINFILQDYENYLASIEKIDYDSVCDSFKWSNIVKKIIYYMEN